MTNVFTEDRTFDSVALSPLNQLFLWWYRIFNIAISTSFADWKSHTRSYRKRCYQQEPTNEVEKSGVNLFSDTLDVKLEQFDGIDKENSPEDSDEIFLPDCGVTTQDLPIIFRWCILPRKTPTLKREWWGRAYSIWTTNHSTSSNPFPIHIEKKLKMHTPREFCPFPTNSNW